MLSGGTTMTNFRPKSRRASESGITVLELVAFGIVFLIILGALFLLTARVTSVLTGRGPTTGTAYVGSYTTPPPQTLTAPTQVVYTIVQRQFQIVGAGPPTIFGNPTPFAGATLTFTVVGGNATVNGGTTATVTTDANGNATVTLAPVRDGSDSLTLTLTIGTNTAIEDAVQFEVDAP
jgi:hypothetical protein